MTPQSGGGGGVLSFPIGGALVARMGHFTLPGCARTLTNALETLNEKAFQRIYTSDLATGCFKSEGHDFADFKGLPGKMKNQNSHCRISELGHPSPLADHRPSNQLPK